MRFIYTLWPPFWENMREICLGDFILRRPGSHSILSVGDNSDHAWCRIEDCTLVDVSLTVKYIYPDIQDVDLVCGNRPDLAKPFAIEHHIDSPDDQFKRLESSDTLLIAYNEKARLSPSPLVLLSDPLNFSIGLLLGIPHSRTSSATMCSMRSHITALSSLLKSLSRCVVTGTPPVPCAKL